MNKCVVFKVINQTLAISDDIILRFLKKKKKDDIILTVQSLNDTPVNMPPYLKYSYTRDALVDANNKVSSCTCYNIL